MQAATAHASRPVGARVLYLWFFLTLATVGFAAMLAGIVRSHPAWTASGGALLGFATLTFLFLQFWALGAVPPTRTGVPVPAPRPTGSLVASTRASSSELEPVARRDASAHEELVEFETVPAPTRLEVPQAFQDAPKPDDPEPEAGWRQRAEPKPSFGRRAFVPAIERRESIISGLPLVTSILAEGPAPEEAETVPTRPGKSRGQCGGCSTFLWAPIQRPIRLRCPKCGKVSTLTE